MHRGHTAIFLAGWVALVAGAPGSRAQEKSTEPAGDTVPLRARVLGIEGLHWRTTLANALELVAIDGTTMVWTVDAKGLGQLFAAATDEGVVASEAKGSSLTVTNYVAWQQRKTDGPPDQATSVTFLSTNGQVKAGTSGEFSGRPDNENGVVATVEIKDTRLIKFETCNVFEIVETKNGNTNIGYSYQVPEIISTAVKGNWTIPKGKALVIGLGVHSVPQSVGEAWAPHERLVVIDAMDLDEGSFTTARKAATVQPRLVFATASGLTTMAVWVIVLVVGGVSLGLIGWSLRRGEERE